MKRTSVIAAACAAAFAVLALPVLAQAPGDTGAGIKRGLEDIGFSGQAGSVTLFRASAGNGTLVVLDVQGQPQGKLESASIQRGKSCNAGDIDPNPVWMLNDVHNGHSTTVVNASMDKLLSGNYVVIVHAGSVPLMGSSMHGNMHGSMHGNMSSQSMSGGNMMINGVMVGKARWTPNLCGQLYHGS